MTFKDWAPRLGITLEAVEACLALPDDEARAAFDDLKAAAKRQYRSYARMLHPDMGGDGEALRSLNEAWTVIESLELDAVDTEPTEPGLDVPEEDVETPSVTVIGNWVKLG